MPSGGRWPHQGWTGHGALIIPYGWGFQAMASLRALQTLWAENWAKPKGQTRHSRFTAVLQATAPSAMVSICSAHPNSPTVSFRRWSIHFPYSVHLTAPAYLLAVCDGASLVRRRRRT